MRQKAVIIDARDNVATALADLKAGETLKLKVGDELLFLRMLEGWQGMPRY